MATPRVDKAFLMELIKAMDFIRYDPSAVLLDGTGLSRTDLNDAVPRLEAARVEVLDDAKLWESDAAAVADKMPAEKLPLDVASSIFLSDCWTNTNATATPAS